MNNDCKTGNQTHSLVKTFAYAILFSLMFCGSAYPQGASKTYALPAGKYTVDRFAVSASGAAILFSSKPNPGDSKRDLFFFDLKSGQINKILTVSSGNIWSVPAPHAFAISTNEALYFVQDDGSVAAPIAMHNNLADLQWTHDGSEFVFPADKPKVDQKSDAYDPSAFTAIGIYDTATGKVRLISLKDSAFHFHLTQTDGKIYIADNSMDSDKPLVVAVYDVKGKHLDPRMDLFGIFFSPAARYYLPFIFEAGLPFKVRDANSDKAVLSFANEGNDEISDPRWNPQEDDLLLVRHAATDDEGHHIVSQQLEVWSVSRRTVLKSFPFGLAAWTPGGKSLVVYRDGKFVFEEVTP